MGSNVVLVGGKMNGYRPCLPEAPLSWWLEENFQRFVGGLAEPRLLRTEESQQACMLPNRTGRVFVCVRRGVGGGSRENNNTSKYEYR